jgi:nicotinamide-nucleotide amidase
MPASSLRQLLERRRVAVAESCTGGLLAQALVSMPGSGEWFRGGLVAYDSDVKFDLLDVTPGPVVTARAATEMAEGVARLLDADVTLAITGAAGPDPQDGAQPGTVFVACFVGGRTRVGEHHFDGPPAQVCEQARDQALRDLARALETMAADTVTSHD